MTWLGYGAWFTHTLAWLTRLKHCLSHWTCGLPKNPNISLIVHTHLSLLLAFTLIVWLFACISPLFLPKPNFTPLHHSLSHTHLHSLIPLLVFSIIVRVINHTNYLEIEEPIDPRRNDNPFHNLYLPHTLTKSQLTFRPFVGNPLKSFKMLPFAPDIHPMLMNPTMVQFKD